MNTNTFAAVSVINLILSLMKGSNAFSNPRTLFVSSLMDHRCGAFCPSSQSPNIVTLAKSKHSHLSSTTSFGEISPEDDKLPAAQAKTLKGKLNKEFLSIAVPAFIQLAAEPLAGLVDTAYLGRLGPDVLGGAGVAISAQVCPSMNSHHDGILA